MQIGDENVHRVRSIMDEVFGSENFVSAITVKKSGSTPSKQIANVTDHLLWYAKSKEMVKFRRLFQEKNLDVYNRKDENGDAFSFGDLQSAGETQTNQKFLFQGKEYVSRNGYHWSTNLQGLQNLAKVGRIELVGNNLRYKRYAKDFPSTELTNIWGDVAGVAGNIYVVQTSTKIIERCLLMTTDPSDLVLDPTCGSGTTAYVAESLGRRWIAVDTSRVAIALARQRLLTGTYDYYKFKDESEGVAGGFVNKTVPHITLRSIAQNSGLDPIFAKHEPILKEKLKILNGALSEVTLEIRTELLAKLAAKEKREKKKAITDADRRRWELPKTEWQEWEVPFDTDPDWPEVLGEALTDYREAWRAKMDAVNACIAASSGGEELVDQPEVDRNKLRVSGPFTVEAVQPPEESLDMDSPIGGEPEEVSDTFEADDAEGEPINAEAYLDQMIRLLRNDGVRFPDNQTLKFTTLEPLEGEILHAEGSWEGNDAEPNVAVVFGPQHGPVTAKQVEQCIRMAYRRGYDTLVFAGFTFDGAAQAAIQDDPDPEVRIHMAHINPDVTMGDLLKDTHTSQLFTVFGLPRTELEMTDNGEYIVKMEGVDIYDPVENKNYSANADRVAAWFLDTDYDGRTFCITQAFFPDKTAWSKIARTLKGMIDEERFEKFSGTESLPFPAGEHARAAVKVIDPRGNEVMRVHDLKSINR